MKGRIIDGCGVGSTGGAGHAYPFPQPPGVITDRDGALLLFQTMTELGQRVMLYKFSLMCTIMVTAVTQYLYRKST